MPSRNITTKKEKEANYKSLISPQLMDEMKVKIQIIIVGQKKYKDKNYSAKQLAKDIGTNTRYISAVINMRFHMNYTSLINKYRIEEAMDLLADYRNKELNIEEVSDMVGFANRQSFYTAFCKMVQMTPRKFRIRHMQEYIEPKDR